MNFSSVGCSTAIALFEACGHQTRIVWVPISTTPAYPFEVFTAVDGVSHIGVTTASVFDSDDDSGYAYMQIDLPDNGTWTDFGPRIRFFHAANF